MSDRGPKTPAPRSLSTRMTCGLPVLSSAVMGIVLSPAMADDVVEVLLAASLAITHLLTRPLGAVVLRSTGWLRVFGFYQFLCAVALDLDFPFGFGFGKHFAFQVTRFGVHCFWFELQFAWPRPDRDAVV